MGSRNLGELVFRPAPLRSLLTPQICRVALPGPLSQSPSTYRRSIQTTPGERSEKSQIRTATAEPESAEQTQKSTDEFSSRIQTLFKNKASSQSSQPISSSSEMRSPFNQASTAYNNSNRPFGSNFSKPPQSQMRPSGQLRSAGWLEEMTIPDPAPQTPELPDLNPTVFSQEKVIYPRLNASTGRSIQLNPERGKDIVGGLRMLGTLVARNKIRHDSFMQRFHERPGLKRKRLKSERWRKRFKKGFNETTARVSKLTRQGW